MVARTRSAEKRVEYDQKAMRIANDTGAQDPGNEAYQGVCWPRSELSMAYSMTFTGDWEQGRKYLQEGARDPAETGHRGTGEPESRQELAHIYYRFGVNSVQSGQPNEGLGVSPPDTGDPDQPASRAPEDAALRSEIAANHHFTGIALSRLGQLKEALRNSSTRRSRCESRTWRRIPATPGRAAMLAGNYAERGSVQLKAGDVEGSAGEHLEGDRTPGGPLFDRSPRRAGAHKPGGFLQPAGSSAGGALRVGRSTRKAKRTGCRRGRGVPAGREPVRFAA